MPVVDDDEVCTPEHCFHAFDTLYCALTNAEPIAPTFPDDKYPLFVTWNTCRPGRTPRLRGCIGNFEPQPLRTGIAEYALVSAFRDHRFARIAAHELASLECGLSLLTDFEDARGYLDWEVGTHGIHVSFTHPPAAGAADSADPSPLSSATQLVAPAARRTAYSATYLPEVAREQGWDARAAVDSAVRKAGWAGRITEDMRRALTVRRYQSRTCAVAWAEYVAWRRARGGAVDADPQ